MALVLPSNRWPLIFFPPAVGAVTDCRQHGKGQHHQRDMAVPAMPGSGLVMIKTEFGLRCLEAILNRPAMALHSDQGLKGGSGWAPGREIRPFAVRDRAADQQAAGP